MGGLGFGVGIEVDLFGRAVEMTWSVRWRRWYLPPTTISGTAFWGGLSKYHFVVMFEPVTFSFHVWIEIDLVLLRGSRVTFFFMEAANDLFFMYRSVEFDFVCAVGIRLVFVCGPITTWL